MNRKQKIIVSVTGIFLVMLILVGLTYAYFLTQITGNTNPKSISVTTADLRLTYGDGTTQILTSDTKLVPSANPIGTKDFTVTNDGDSTSYAVIIENVIVRDATTEELTTFNSNDFVYTLSCTSNNGTCNEVSEQTMLPMSDSILVENEIEKDEVHTYEIVVYYLETNKDQSSDMNKKLEARINIEDVNRINPYSSNTNSLAYNIINNALNVSAEEEVNGYAIYRSIPLTKPAEEITSNYDIITSDNYQSTITIGFHVVGDDYSVTPGGFVLTNPKVVNYSEDYNELHGKYLTSIWYYSDEDDANQAALSKTYHHLYKVGEQSDLNNIYYSRISLEISDNVENSLSTTVDDYTETTGINSYYFRGNVQNNYVEFANMCWRIVRIEGDGSIKLILEDQDSPCASSNGNWNIPISSGSSVTSGTFGYKLHPEYVNPVIAEYLNPDDSSTAMITAFKNFQSTINSNINSLYSGKNIANFMKYGNWCVDYSAYTDVNTDVFNATSLTNDERIEKIYNYQEVFYDNFIRLYGNEIYGYKPTLQCRGTVVNDYNDNTNMYVATLTTDEMAYAGWKMYYPNDSYYLENGSITSEWWPLSPSFYQGGYMGDVISVKNYNYLTAYDEIEVDYRDDDLFYGVYQFGSLPFRPAIVLKAGISLADNSGNGTKTSPYKINYSN